MRSLLPNESFGVGIKKPPAGNHRQGLIFRVNTEVKTLTELPLRDELSLHGEW